jgi:catechol 2,3-dioxygenase-like lactoylglutathione lyase family enzyme
MVTAMTIKQIDHIAINTVNIDESVKFYSEVMGFEELRRVPNGDNVLVYMKINDSSTIELFDHEKQIDYSEHPGSASGTAHFAFSVNNIQEWNDHLIKHHVIFTLPLCPLEHLGKNVLLFKDPNGVVIELSEDL